MQFYDLPAVPNRTKVRAVGVITGAIMHGESLQAVGFFFLTPDLGEGAHHGPGLGGRRPGRGGRAGALAGGKYLIIPPLIQLLIQLFI